MGTAPPQTTTLSPWIATALNVPKIPDVLFRGPVYWYPVPLKFVSSFPDGLKATTYVFPTINASPVGLTANPTVTPPPIAPTSCIEIPLTPYEASGCPLASSLTTAYPVWLPVVTPSPAP